MRTRAIVLAVLVCSATALAQNPLGDDSGPNANDGQCDDTRFENIGAGNSNIVFWEGGRYDGRDATDCADLLLQGLIAWRRDTAVVEVPGEPETPTVAEARQQQATATVPARPSGPLCTDTADEPCWMELDDLPDCHIWIPNPQQVKIDSWSGQCSDGLGTGTGIFDRVNDEGTTVESPYVNGVIHGTEVVRWVSGSVEETPWVNGVRHGTSIGRNAEAVWETPYVSGEIHGTRIWRSADGSVIEMSYVNGERHGTEIERFVNLGETETPYVNGEIHGTQIRRNADGDVTETPYVNGKVHGTMITRYADGGVEDTPYVNGERHGTRVWRRTDGSVRETPYVNGEIHGTETWRHPNGRVVVSIWVNGEIEVPLRCVAGCD